MICNIFCNINIITLLKNLFLLKYLPKLGNGTGYGLLFIFGVLTSFHCIGMCGGIAISQSVKKAEDTTKLASYNKFKLVVLPSFFYNLGRVISYTIVGAIVGGLGHIISFSGPWKGVIPIVGGIFMIIMAINLLGIFPFLRRFNIRMPSFAAKKIFKGNNYSPIIVGLLTGLMPCGPLQIVQLYALSTRSVIVGALSMLVFSIGTVPLLFTFGAINTILNKKFSKIVLKISSVIVLVMGIVMIGRGLALSGVCIGMPEMVNKSPEGFSIVQGSYQSVKTEIGSDSFPPIEVVKGIPVKWHIHVDKDNLNECNNAIQIPSYKITKNFVVGDNIVEFTPDKSGEFIYTCWMGMIKSKIKVVDSEADLKKDQSKQLKNNKKDNSGDEALENVVTPSTTATAAVTLTPTPMVHSEASSADSTASDSSSITTAAVPSASPAAAASSGVTVTPAAGTPASAAANPVTPIPTTITIPSTTPTPAPSSTAVPIEKPAATPALLSFTGYIIDEDCFVNESSDPGSDTKVCLNMKSCASSGYGIAVSENGSYKFYYFDGNFAPNASGTQVRAADLVKNTSKKDHVTVVVKGNLNGNSKTAADGSSYPVISVTSLTEN